MSDALDDLHGCEADLAAFYAESDALARATARPAAPYVAPVPAGFVPLYTHQRCALTADLGFLAVVAPDLFAWRVGGLSVAQHHAAGAMQPVAEDQAAAAKARRHREYCDGLRIRPLPEAQ